MPICLTCLDRLFRLIMTSQTGSDLFQHIFYCSANLILKIDFPPHPTHLISPIVCHILSCLHRLANSMCTWYITMLYSYHHYKRKKEAFTVLESTKPSKWGRFAKRLDVYPSIQFKSGRSALQLSPIDKCYSKDMGRLDTLLACMASSRLLFH